MHEYSVASELINSLLPKAADVEGKIVNVFLKKGELRILSDQALANAFELLAEGTLLEGAHLTIEHVPVRVSCDSCGYDGPVDHVSDEGFHFAVPILSCPTCQSEVDMKSGRELFVDRLSVRVPPQAEQE